MTGIGLALKTRGCEAWDRHSDGNRIRLTDHGRKFIQRGTAPPAVPCPAAAHRSPKRHYGAKLLRRSMDERCC